jgi:HEPN domain-containing protein
MNPLALEWVAKAEEDFNVAQREYRARKNPAYNAACFHAQQCAEKYLKARLQEANIAFPRPHSLPVRDCKVVRKEARLSLGLPV